MSTHATPSAGSQPATDPATGEQVSRRDFFRLSAGAVAGGSALVTAGVAGVAHGGSAKTMPGWESREGSTSSAYLDRTPFHVERPTYKVIGPQRRIHWTERVVERGNMVKAKVVDAGGSMELLPPELQAYYAAGNMSQFNDDVARFKSIIPARAARAKQDADEMLLTTLYDKAWHAVKTEPPGRPEVADWQGVAEKKREVKDPAALARLIKKLGKSFGATMVGITRLNPAWVYQESAREWRGYKALEPIEIPTWWEYAIVVGVPHDWELVKSRPTFGTDQDGYNTSSIAGARLVAYIKGLGYPARLHSLDVGYEVVFPPIAIDAGLGEQGRFGFCLTPEFGGNFRPAVVTTSLPMEVDRPINAHIADFCMHCGICAEQCPSGAIPDGPPRDNGRGVVKWTIDTSACYNFRLTSRGSATCGICIAVCPWTNRDNLVHGVAKQALMRDATGVLAQAAVAGEKALYVTHRGNDFRPPQWATVRQPPWFMRTDTFFKI